MKHGVGPLLLALLLISLLSFELFFIYQVVHQYQWAGPVQDFWGSIPYIEKTFSGESWLSSATWYAQNNHRVALPRLSFLVDYHFFHGSNQFLTGISLVFIFTEILVFAWILKDIQSRFLFLIFFCSASTILLSPSVSYNLLNTFNIQWIQCAFLALISCAAYAFGLHKSNPFFIGAAIIFSILTCFTTFSITSIWPSLFFVAWLSQAKKSQWILLLFSFISFSILFIFYLPVDSSLGNGAQYSAPPLFASIMESENSLKHLLSVLFGLIGYVIVYFSPAFTESLSLISNVVTIACLMGVFTSVFLYKSYYTHWTSACLIAVMLFCILLALTTGIGRSFMGELSQGPRFHPISLLFWAAFTVNSLLFLSHRKNTRSLVLLMIIVLLVLLPTAFYQAVNISKRLAEEHNRYARMQMAYLTENFSPNAIYENLVPEWRATSYPGILKAIPFLDTYEKGIFHTIPGKFLKEHQTLDATGLNTCLSATLNEKPRNKDPEIRNITITSNEAGANRSFPYLFIYSNESAHEKARVTGAAFRKREPLLSFSTISSTWVGISARPVSPETHFVAGLNKDGIPCRLQWKKSETSFLP